MPLSGIVPQALEVSPILHVQVEPGLMPDASTSATNVSTEGSSADAVVAETVV
jgi:hypothetical protein